MQAITLLEVVVAMLLGSMVVAMAYGGFERLQNRYVESVCSKENREEVVMLNDVIQLDFERAHRIAVTREGIVSFTTRGRVEYLLNERCLVRKMSPLENELEREILSVDTLSRQVSAFDPYWRLSPGGRSVLTRLDISIGEENSGLWFRFNKAYTVQDELEHAH